MRYRAGLRLLISMASLAGPCLAQTPGRSGAAAGLPGRPLFGGPASSEQVARLKTMAAGLDTGRLPWALADTLRDLKPDDPEHQRLMAPLARSEALLRAEAAAGAALDFGDVVSRAEQLVEAQMRESLEAGAVEELDQLRVIVAAYRPEEAEAFDSASARRQGAKDLAVRMAAELTASAPSVPLPEPEAVAAIRREMTQRAILPPSLVQQYMAQVYNSYPEHDSSSAYARYIQPLRDARAKRMLHAFLIYAGGHPEGMRSLPYEQAREHIVEAANRLSERHDPEDPAGLSEAIGLYAAELDGLRSRLAPPAARDSAASPEEPPTPPHRTSPLSPSAGLDYFPGWPEITEHYGDLLRGGRMRLVKDEESARRPHDEEAYQIFLGQESVGRFTIRRYTDRVERNILFMENGRMASYGRSDSPIDDLARRTRQQAARLWDRIRR